MEGQFLLRTSFLMHQESWERMLLHSADGAHPPVCSFLYVTWECVYCHHLHVSHKMLCLEMVSFLPLLTAERGICRTSCLSENIGTMVLKVGSSEQQYKHVREVDPLHWLAH